VSYEAGFQFFICFQGSTDRAGYERLRIRVIAGINLAKKDVFGARSVGDRN